MAADDEDDMEWLNYETEEEMQHPKSDVDEGDADYELPELEWGFISESRRESLTFQSVGRSTPDKVVSQEYESEVGRALRRSPRRSADSTTWRRPCQLPSRSPVLREVQRAGGSA